MKLARQHRAGEEAQSDFTHATGLGITIPGEVFPHILVVLVLPFSNLAWATVCLSEPMAALRRGIQRALFQLGRVPTYHQTDNSTAATHRIPTNKKETPESRKRMPRADLDEFVQCYNPGGHHKRKPTWSEKKNPEGRWRSYTYKEIAARDKCSLDLFWLRNESLEDPANLSAPHILAQEIADDLRSALGQIEDIMGDLDDRASVHPGPPSSLDG